jgi:hypothetical protein
MATKAEQLRQQQERHGISPKARKRDMAKTRAEKFGEPHPARRAARKASYALDVPSKEGVASRKSSRAAANRIKPDTNLNLREEQQKGSPTSRFRKTHAKGMRVRGTRAGP